jgi:hypothetical protein
MEVSDSASCSVCFTTKERASSTYHIRGWTEPRVNMNIVVKRKIPAFTGNIIVANRFIDLAILVHMNVSVLTEL